MDHGTSLNSGLEAIKGLLQFIGHLVFEEPIAESLITDFGGELFGSFHLFGIALARLESMESIRRPDGEMLSDSFVKITEGFA